MQRNFFLIPLETKVKIIKTINDKYLIFMFTEKIIISFLLPSYLYFDLSTNIIKLQCKNKNFKKLLYISKHMSLLNITLWYSFLLKQVKITFKGKSYKACKPAKKVNSINLDFHKAHNSYFIFFNIFFKKLRKQKLLLLAYDYFFILKFAGNIVNIRPLNSYTKRGIRLKRQKYFKRVSKKSLKKK